MSTTILVKCGNTISKILKIKDIWKFLNSDLKWTKQTGQNMLKNYDFLNLLY